MTATQPEAGILDVQQAVYAVAQSLDAFLVNGIQYGVVRGAMFPGLVEKLGGNLLADLDGLEDFVLRGPEASQAKARKTLATLKIRCQQLIELTSELRSFRTVPLERLRAKLAQVTILRGNCVELIKELEVCLETPQPFYQSRTRQSAEGVSTFLSNLESVFADARSASTESTSMLR